MNDELRLRDFRQKLFVFNPKPVREALSQASESEDFGENEMADPVEVINLVFESLKKYIGKEKVHGLIEMKVRRRYECFCGEFYTTNTDSEFFTQ